ncbi:Acetyl-coenzyme A carboxyl transferase alpha chain [Alkalibacterium sp. AK22]|uniref:acetyl-CoA carboxylase carboxyltransferase subunit alpha n=1 Tax=Alkalibacterium sp. AK22 TaxID=1229520 RepID=UPI00044E2399|nr:acetyl-CoA carboxylase carboxyltransferase subunit alpha [Alkalibacterium sp. AK22]EXJ24164.1 Acetyl-coenzyme A carboxyl transferase alpha chain [Alkalibacterium sp. AK22]
MTNVMDTVALARKTDRISIRDITSIMIDDFIELHGDRLYRDDTAIVGGIGRLSGRPVTVIGNQKGTSIEENMQSNFGSAHPEGYRKALRLMKQAEKFNRPVLNFINTSGAYCGVDAENRGQGEAIARNLLEMSKLSVPVLSIILGEGGSGGALALAVADEVWMMEHSIYSILSPEGFASILWKDAKKAGEAAELMKLTSADLKELGIIDQVIPEQSDGEWLSKESILSSLKIEIDRAFTKYEQMNRETLLNRRYERFRKF